MTDLQQTYYRQVKNPNPVFTPRKGAGTLKFCEKLMEKAVGFTSRFDFAIHVAHARSRGLRRRMPPVLRRRAIDALLQGLCFHYDPLANRVQCSITTLAIECGLATESGAGKLSITRATRALTFLSELGLITYQTEYDPLIGCYIPSDITFTPALFAALREWGWRIPFALGAVLAVVALWLRRQLDETSQQETRALKEAGSLKGLWRNRRAFIMVLGFTAAGSLCFYTFTTYMQKYLVNTAGMHANVASGIMTAALFVFMLIQPLIGALSDKIGRRTSMLCFGSLAAIFTVPILSALQNVSSPYAAFGLVMCALLIVSFYTSISGILKAEMFPAQVRALGVGLSYAVANAIFGGSAEYVALSLKSIGMETAFFWYVTLMAVVAFLVSLMLHRKGKGMRL